MSSCCESSPLSPVPSKHPCPLCNSKCSKVKTKTMLHHIRSPWKHTFTSQHYYFCESPDCEVVYVGEDDSTINIADIRITIGQKQTGNKKILCYCFGVTLTDAKHNPEAKEFVIKQTKSGSCSCESSNPSGRCCLKDFPRNKQTYNNKNNSETPCPSPGTRRNVPAERSSSPGDSSGAEGR